MKTQKSTVKPDTTEDWAETPGERAFVMAALAAIPRRLGVTREMVMRHTLSVDKRDGLREALNQRVKDSMKRRRVGRPYGDAAFRSAFEAEKTNEAKRVNTLALLCVTIAAEAAGAPPTKVIGRLRTREILEARWMAVLATYEIMEFKSMMVLSKAFGMHHDTVRHIRVESRHWPVPLLARLAKVIVTARAAAASTT